MRVKAVVVVLIGATLSAPPAHARELAGSRWMTTRIDGESSGIRQTIRFYASGHIRGRAYCKKYSARYQRLEGDGLRIRILTMTRSSCDGDAKKLGRRFERALVRTRSYRRTSSRLELRGASGRILAVLRPFPVPGDGIPGQDFSAPDE